MRHFLLTLVLGLVVLAAAGPALAALAQAAVPLVIAVGVVILLARGLWYFTRRW